MKSNKIFLAGIAVLILGIGFAVGTYAYYQTTVTGSTTGTVLAWWCRATGDTAEFTISLGSLYPGSSGEKSITITSSMAADYTVQFGTFLNFGDGQPHDNLQLYRVHGSGTSYSSPIHSSDVIEGSTTGSNGNYSATVTFYYYWPYGTAVEDYESGAPSTTITLTCKQKNVQ